LCQESGQDKEVKGNKRTNRVHSGKKVLNSVNVNTFTVLSKLNCSYKNADQLFNKMAELIVRPRDNKPNIIGITEVKPKLNRYKPALAEFSLTEVGSYKMFEKHIDREEGRGLILYLDNKLEATEIHIKTNFRENLFAKIKLNQTDKLLVGVVYRSPSNRTSEYSDKLCSLISEATNKGYSHILIIGDFNYPDIDWENWNTKGDNTNNHEMC
jgi:hypothetical protein